jgi:hypothetical protein
MQLVRVGRSSKLRNATRIKRVRAQPDGYNVKTDKDTTDIVGKLTVVRDSNNGKLSKLSLESHRSDK